MLMLCRTDGLLLMLGEEGGKIEEEVVFGIKERAFHGICFGVSQAKVEEAYIFVRTAERVFLLSRLPLYHEQNQFLHGGILYKYHPAHTLSCKTCFVTNHFSDSDPAT